MKKQDNEIGSLKEKYKVFQLETRKEKKQKFFKDSREENKILNLLKNSNIEISNAQEMLRKILSGSKHLSESKQNFNNLLEKNDISLDSIEKILLPFADPTLDIAFKMLFGQDKNKDILISLLNSLLNFTGEKEIEDVEINNNELPVSNISNIEGQTGISTSIDLVCTNKDKQKIAIEMQGQKTKYFLTREQEYMAELLVGQVKEGEGKLYHEKVLDTYIIVIGKNNMFAGNTAIADQKLFEIDVKPMILQTNEIYPNNKMHWKFYELPKFKKSAQYLQMKEYDKIDGSDNENLLEEKYNWLENNQKYQWLEFLIDCNSQTEIPDRNTLIKKGYNIMKMSKWNPDQKASYWRQKAREADLIKQKEYDREEGFNEGKLKGEIKGEFGKIKMGIELSAPKEKIIKRLKYTKYHFDKILSYLEGGHDKDTDSQLYNHFKTDLLGDEFSDSSDG
jgi:predicted transposase/invertase (TIGR01784 family)